jgi:hypothetical protein
MTSTWFFICAALDGWFWGEEREREAYFEGKKVKLEPKKVQDKSLEIGGTGEDHGDGQLRGSG